MFSKKKLRSNLGYGDIDPLTIDINERFINACENGDYPTVKRILLTIKDFNIEIADNLGRTALRLAVENEHLEVVQALLAKSDSAKIREALLLAIFLGHSHIAESILKHPKYKILNEKKFLNGDSDSFWQTPSSDDAQFPPDITPLILAAQYNRTEIVQMLIVRGDRIVKPHDFDCKCNECHNRFKFDSLRHAQSRLNSYRGLASESYISLVSIDPILSSFLLGRELRDLSMKEKFFKNEYLNLANNLSAYTVKLLSNVRGRDELEIVLNKTGKEGEEKYERLARLDLALKYKEKPFVAHPNCQQKLVEIWYTGLRPVSKMNNLFFSLLFICFIFFLPFLIVIYMIAPKTKAGNFMTQPCIKFITHTTFYAVFIALIIVSSLQFASEENKLQKFSSLYPSYYVNFTNYINNENISYKFFESDFYIRPSFPSNIDMVLTIWIIGLAWHEIKQIYQDGIRDYLLSVNNIIDSCMIVLYLGSFALKYYAIFSVNINLKKLESTSFWQTVNNLDQYDAETQKSIFYSFYWLNEDRFYWISFDPINVAEALFAIANLFSFGRVCFLLPANQNLGPLQITLGQMINDIFKFIVIFVIIFLAFMFSINNLYWYYLSNVRNNVEVNHHLDDETNSSITRAEKAFGTIQSTFTTIFWSIFGLGDSGNISLKPFNNQLTEFFGFILYGTFHIASIIVLLNMLIAMMTKSYESILQDSDVEWKFARSRLYMESIKKGGTLPVPLNIIPTPKSIFYIFKNIVGKIKGNEKKIPETSSDNGLDILARKSKIKNGDELTYTIVMQRIVKRFLLHNQRESSDSNERNFEELKQDLQMIRYEMQNDLKKSKEESFHSITLLHAGLTILGDEIFKNTTFMSENLNRFNEYKLYGNEMREMYKDEFAEHTTDENGEIIQTVSANHKQFPFQQFSMTPSKKKTNLKKHLSFYEIVNQALVHADSTETKSVLESSASIDQVGKENNEYTESNESIKKQVQFNELDTIHQIEDLENDIEVKQIDFIE
ncbi:unnamed protein product [Brachionus calyciflorus]|uniref:Transient receptor ion channel domain-containing protein n=1 Tax=Brachionus calyciflorus TaxID=104777 RepID=A0A813MBG6_9BILA|nr:unnamed protein product [Brachionus calyciflorus]